jgi:hypothetical protein
VGDNSPRYRLVYRDQFASPLTLVEYGKTIPKKEDLIAFAIRLPSDALKRREQLEALCFYRAGLAPLAAEWIKRGSGDGNNFLPAAVQEPLRDKSALFWEVRGRYNAGPDRQSPYEVTGYVNTIPDPKIIAKWMDADLKVMIKELNEIRAKEMDKFEPVHPDELPQLIKFQRSLAGPLEHIHFAVGDGVKRNYLASYRLVSERFAKGERIYFVERVEGNKVSILDTLLEPPSYETMRDKVLAWIDGADRVPAKATRLVTFDELDTAKGPVSGKSLYAHFARSGAIFAAGQYARVDVIKAKNLEPTPSPWGKGVMDQNLLRFAAKEMEPAMFTLHLSRPSERVWFRRVLLGPQNPWRATALDADGRVLDTICEGYFRVRPTNRSEGAPFTEFCLRGPEIVVVRFEVGFNPWYPALFDNLKFEFNGSP